MSKAAEQPKWKWWAFQVPVYAYIVILALSIPLIIFLSIFTDWKADIWQTFPLLALLFAISKKNAPTLSPLDKEKKADRSLIEPAIASLNRLALELTDDEENSAKIWESYLKIRFQFAANKIQDRELQKAFENWNRRILNLFREKILALSSELLRETENRLHQNLIPVKKNYEPRKIQKYFESNPTIEYSAHFLSRNLIENAVCKLLDDYRAPLSIYRKWMEEKHIEIAYLKNLAHEMRHFEKHQETTNCTFPFKTMKTRA